MKTFTLRARSLFTVGSLLIGSTSGLLAADLVLRKVPPLTVAQIPTYPENLARHHLGAQMQTLTVDESNTGGKASTLLSGDPAASYALSPGTTTLLVALPQIENIGSIGFVNEGTQGSITVATSNAKLPADSPQWREAVQQELSPEGVDAKVGPSEAKYVRLTFNVSAPGKIAGFGVYSTPQVSDFTRTRSSKAGADDKTGSFGLISYNQTDIHGKARALYVSSGSDVKQANNMIDDQPATTYSFAAEDGTPTAVIDLGKPCNLRRVSAAYSARPGKMDFYVMQSLPKTKGASALADAAPQTVTMGDAEMGSMTSVGSFSDDGSHGRAAVDFPEMTGRYVMVRWTPAVQQDSSFTLAEVAALGGPQNNMLLAANTATTSGTTTDEDGNSTTQVSDGKTMLDGKTMIDAKDMPGDGPADEPPQSPAEGPAPTLPQPPPFTFVPILSPITR